MSGLKKYMEKCEMPRPVIGSMVVTSEPEVAIESEVDESRTVLISTYRAVEGFPRGVYESPDGSTEVIVASVDDITIRRQGGGVERGLAMGDLQSTLDGLSEDGEVDQVICYVGASYESEIESLVDSLEGFVDSKDDMKFVSCGCQYERMERVQEELGITIEPLAECGGSEYLGSLVSRLLEGEEE
jgi:hypothetical protein